MSMTPFLEARVDMAKILAVDDEPLACDFLKKFLGRQGYEVSVDTTGKQALELIQAERPHLVLLDIRMPGMDGMEVLHHIRASRDKRVARVPVLMLTVKRDADTVIEAIQKGATDYLVKPVNREELMSRVKKILESDKLPD